MARAELVVYINNFVKQVEAKHSNKDPVRNLLNSRVQAYIVNPRVIFREMLRPESPFRVQMDAGALTASAARRVARGISEEYYKELKATATKFKSFKVSGGKLPGDFYNDNIDTVGYDDRTKILYYKSSKSNKDNYKKFSTAIVSPTIKKIKSSESVGDDLRTYVSPDAEFVALMNTVNAKANAESDRDGLGDTTPKEKKARQSRRRRARNDYLRDNDLSKRWQGIDIGHVFGAKATGAAYLTDLDNPHDVAKDLDNFKLAANLSDLEPELLEVLVTTIKYDIEATWERVYRNKVVSAKMVLLIPESFVNNRFSGGAAGADAQRRLNAIVLDLSRNLHKLKGSPSVEDLIVEVMELHFLGKKASNKKYFSKAKKTLIDKQRIPVRGIPSKRVIIKSKSKNNIRKTKDGSYNLQSLMAFLNAKLHDKIQQNMGKGNSKRVLNYQTGRFAKSAKIKQLLPSKEKGAINATVKYMRNPYGVFEPGAHPTLSTPGRNPAKIFGKSIRQLLQEEKIANLRRVKVTLRG